MASDPSAPATGRPPAPRDARAMVDMARAFLVRKAVENPRLEAELLVAHALGLERLGLFLRLDQPVTPAEVDRARDLLVRRGRREPVAYITGAKEFYGRRFAVGPGCLIPRPETELMIDLARETAGEREGLAVLDIGTGSGCLAVTAALELATPEVTAVDISETALAWAQRNAAALAAAVTCVHADGLATWDERGPYDIVLSNPPYIDTAEAPTLAPEVREHEPASALFAPPGDRDHWLRELVARAGEGLRPGGVLLVELGHTQGPRARELAASGAAGSRVERDLAGVDRVLVWLRG